MRNPARSALLLAVGLSLVSNSCLVTAASAMSMPGLTKKSSNSFDLPTAEKIEVSDTASDVPQDPSKNPDLAPMTLTETKPATTDTAGATTAPGTTPSGTNPETLNASVTTNDFVPKGPLEGENSGLLAPTSVKGSKVKSIDGLGSGSLLETAKSLNAAPLTLMDSSEETERKIDEEREIEREQLTALWEATLTRSPDISFVLQKLMPSSDPSKVTSVLMRMTTTAMFGAIGTVGAMYPGTGTYAMQNLSYSVLSNLLGLTESAAAKKAKITQTEQIMLFQMIRKTADNLVEKYRSYKTKHHVLYKANADFEDMKNLATDAKKDGAKSIEVEYTLRKQQRDIDEIGRELGKYRQGLIDLAGADAVAKLDANIDEEFKKLHPELCPNSSVADSSKQESPQIIASPEKLVDPSKQVAGSGNNFKLPL